MPELNEIVIREHDQLAGVKRVSLFPSSALRIIDESISPATTYIGLAAPGTSTSSLKAWFIEKIVVSGTTTTITHASDSWDNRALAIYS